MNCYFFEIKNEIYNYTIERLKQLLTSKKLEPLRIQKYNRLKKLLRKWTFLSTNCHYKITDAKKRLHKK